MYLHVRFLHQAQSNLPFQSTSKMPIFSAVVVCSNSTGRRMCFFICWWINATVRSGTIPPSLQENFVSQSQRPRLGGSCPNGVAVLEKGSNRRNHTRIRTLLFSPSYSIHRQRERYVVCFYGEVSSTKRLQLPKHIVRVPSVVRFCSRRVGRRDDPSKSRSSWVQFQINPWDSRRRRRCGWPCWVCHAGSRHSTT